MGWATKIHELKNPVILMGRNHYFAKSSEYIIEGPTTVTWTEPDDKFLLAMGKLT